jgi:hypothetical protein
MYDITNTDPQPMIAATILRIPLDFSHKNPAKTMNRFLNTELQ